MSRTVQWAGAIVGAALVVCVTAVWIGSVIDAAVWVFGTAGANAAIQHGGVSPSCSGVSALVPVGFGSSFESLLRGWSGTFLVFAGYSRYDDSDPLDHDTRREIYEHSREDPGVFLSGLSDRLDVPLSTVRHHVRILEDESLISSRKIRGKRRYYPVDIDDQALLAALSESATATVLEALDRIGPATGSELARTLDRDPSTVSHHLTRLADDGLIDRERRGRTVVSHLSSNARTALSSV